jgi:hypothetical protein
MAIKNKSIIPITISILASSAIIIAIFIMSKKPAQTAYIFTRLSSNKTINPINILNIQYNSYYIAGASSDKIYLANILSANHIVECSNDLTDTTHITLDLEETTKDITGDFQTTIDPPYAFILTPSSPHIISVDIKRKTSTIKKLRNFFTLGMPLSSSSIIIRSVDSRTNEYMIGKASTLLNETHFNREILTKQIDGTFCTDGTITYNKAANKIIYTYYYRNQFIVLDTTLKILYKANTIDPIEKAQITIDSLKSNKSKTLSSPPLLVNFKTSANKFELFINSKILSNTENKSKFQNSSVLDIYDITNGSYKYSIYVPDRGSKLIDFRVVDDILYVLHEKYLVKYKISDQM